MTQPTTTTTVTTTPTPPVVAAIVSPQVVQIASGTQNVQVPNASAWEVDGEGNLNLVNTEQALVATFASGQWDNVQIVG